MRTFFFAFLVHWLLVACTRAPEIPKLKTYPPTPLQQIILSEKLGPQEIRELFRAVNQDGKLDGLKPYLEAPSDATLSEIGGLVSRYLYEEALHPTGALRLLEKRTQAKAFYHFYRDLRVRSASSDFSQATSLLWTVVGMKEFPSLFERDLVFFSPALQAILNGIQKEAKLPPTAPFPPAAPLAYDTLVNDLTAFVEDSRLKKATTEAFLTLTELEFWDSGLKALKRARLEGKEKAFIGLGLGLGRLLHPENRLEGVLALFEKLDAPSEGLFKEAAKKLNEEGGANQLAHAFLPNFAAGIATFVREALDKGPAQERFDRFKAIRTGIEGITGSALPETAPDFLIANLPIHLHAYALERWLEEVLRHPKNAALRAQVLAKGFSPELWKLPVEVPRVDLQFLEFTEDKETLSRKIREELDSYELKPFSDALSRAIANEGLGNFVYRFSKASDRPLKEALEAAVRVCQTVRPFADAGPTVRAFMDRFLRLDGRGFSMASLETDNLLDSLNSLLLFVGEKNWPALKSFLFNDMKLGQLDPETRRAFLSLYDHAPKLKERVSFYLDHLPYLAELDEPVESYPSPLFFYHRLLGAQPKDDLRAVRVLTRYLAEAPFFKGTLEDTPFRATREWLVSGRDLSEWAWGLSSLSKEKRRLLLGALENSFAHGKPSGIELHLSILEQLLPEHAEAMAAALRQLSRGLPVALTSEEYLWFQRVVEAKDHEKLWRFFASHGSQQTLRKLVQELRRLAHAGYLTEAFSLLSQVQNDRIRYFSAVVVDALRRGEVDALLASLELVILKSGSDHPMVPGSVTP